MLKPRNPKSIHPSLLRASLQQRGTIQHRSRKSQRRRPWRTKARRACNRSPLKPTMARLPRRGKTIHILTRKLELTNRTSRDPITPQDIIRIPLVKILEIRVHVYIYWDIRVCGLLIGRSNIPRRKSFEDVYQRLLSFQDPRVFKL